MFGERAQIAQSFYELHIQPPSSWQPFEDCRVSRVQNGCPPGFLDSWNLLNSLILRSELSVELVLGRRRGRSGGVRRGVAGRGHHGLEPAVLLRGGRRGQEVGGAGWCKGGCL